MARHPEALHSEYDDMPMAGTPQNVSDLWEALEHVDESLQRLAKLTHILTGRLGPVLRGEESGEARGKPEVEPRSDAARRVAGQRHSIVDVTDRLDDLLSRLDLP